MLITRRRALGSTALGTTAALLRWAHAWAADQPFAPEKDARLQLLRGSTFLPAEGETTAANIAAFSAATGVEVKVENITRTICRRKPRWRRRWGQVRTLSGHRTPPLIWWRTNWWT